MEPALLISVLLHKVWRGTLCDFLLSSRVGNAGYSQNWYSPSFNRMHLVGCSWGSLSKADFLCLEPTDFQSYELSYDRRISSVADKALLSLEAPRISTPLSFPFFPLPPHLQLSLPFSSILCSQTPSTACATQCFSAGLGALLDALQMWAVSGAFTWNSNCLKRFNPVTKFSNLQTASKAHAPI